MRLPLSRHAGPFADVFRSRAFLANLYRKQYCMAICIATDGRIQR